MSKLLSVALCLTATVAAAYHTGIVGLSQTGCGACHGGGATPTVTLNGPGTLASGTAAQYSLVISGGTPGGTGLDVSVNGGSLSLSGSDGPSEQTSAGEVTHSAQGPGTSSVTYTFHVTAGPGSSMTLYAAGQQGTTNSNSGFALASLGVTITGGSSAPTVATPANANPSTVVVGATSQLNVLGGPAGSESSYTYAWSSSPAGVTFSPNGSHQAQNTTATFPGAGGYTLTATITNAASQTVQSSVGVAVNSTGALPPKITRSAQPAQGTVAGNSVALSVSALSQTGSALSYAWSSAGPGVTFSSQSANTTANFTAAGTYSIGVVVTDPSSNGGSASSSTQVVVAQTPSAITVGPQVPALQAGASQVFSATAVDQFSGPMDTSGVVWSVAGDGTIDSAGTFVAGETSGAATVTATLGPASGQTAITVSSSPGLIQSGSPGSSTVQGGCNAGGAGSVLALLAWVLASRRFTRSHRRNV